MLLTDFLNQFIKDYDKTCIAQRAYMFIIKKIKNFFDKVGIKIKIFNFYFKTFPSGTKYFELFYEDLFDDLGLTTFYKQSFVLFL